MDPLSWEWVQMSQGGWSGMEWMRPAISRFPNLPFPFFSMNEMSEWPRSEMGMGRASSFSRWSKVPCSSHIAQLCSCFCKQGGQSFFIRQ